MLDSIFSSVGWIWRTCCRRRPQHPTRHTEQKTRARAASYRASDSEHSERDDGGIAVVAALGQEARVLRRRQGLARQRELAATEQAKRDAYRKSQRSGCTQAKEVATTAVREGLYRRGLVPSAATLKSAAATMLLSVYVIQARVAAEDMTPEQANEDIGWIFGSIKYGFLPVGIVLSTGVVSLLAGMLTRSSHTGPIQELLEKVVPLFAFNVKDVDSNDISGLWVAVGLSSLVVLNSVWDVDKGWLYNPFKPSAQTVAGQRSPFNGGFAEGESLGPWYKIAVRAFTRFSHIGTDALLGYFTVHELLDYLWVEAEQEHNTVVWIARFMAGLYAYKSMGEMWLGYADTAAEMRQSFNYLAATTLSVIRQGGLTLLQSIVVLEHLVEEVDPADMKFLDLLELNPVSATIWTISASLTLTAMGDTVELAREYYRSAQAVQVAHKFPATDDGGILGRLAAQARGEDPLKYTVIGEREGIRFNTTAKRFIGLFVLPAARPEVANSPSASRAQPRHGRT